MIRIKPEQVRQRDVIQVRCKMCKCVGHVGAEIYHDSFEFISSTGCYNIHEDRAKHIFLLGRKVKDLKLSGPADTAITRVVPRVLTGRLVAERPRGVTRTQQLGRANPYAIDHREIARIVRAVEELPARPTRFANPWIAEDNEDNED